jgi:hypothetical protein
MADSESRTVKKEKHQNGYPDGYQVGGLQGPDLELGKAASKLVARLTGAVNGP